MSDVYKINSTTLQNIRKYAGFTPYDLATKAEIPILRLHHIEHTDGEAEVTHDEITNICLVLDCNEDDLVSDFEFDFANFALDALQSMFMSAVKAGGKDALTLIKYFYADAPVEQAVGEVFDAEQLDADLLEEGMTPNVDVYKEE